MAIEAEALRALSEKATQGEWHVDWLPAWNEDNGAEEPPVCDGICIHTPEHEAESVLCCSEREAAFIVALVNAYRDGSLIHRSALAEDTARAAEGMREQAAKAADDWLKLFGDREPKHVSAQTWAGDAVRDIAEAIRALPLDKEAAR